MTHRLLLTACGLCLVAFVANGQSVRDRLREARDGAREAAAAAKQDARPQERAASNDGSAQPAAQIESQPQAQSTAPPVAARAPAVQPSAPGGEVFDVEPYLQQATAIGNECRSFPDNQFKPGCLKQCDDTAKILTQARGQSLPPGTEARAREAVRLCGAMRDYAKDPANAGR